MAVYATPAQIRLVLTRNVAVPGGTAADLDDPTIQAQIDAAQAEIDSTLAKRYTVPFTVPVPPLITQIAIAIAAYLATLVHRGSLELDLGPSDPSLLRYEWASALLGSLELGDADIPEITQADGSHDPLESRSTKVSNPYSGKLFGLDTWDLDYADHPGYSRRYQSRGGYW